MAEKKTPFLHVRVEPEHKRMLDELRKAESDLPTESEMIRRLIERASAAPKRGRK